jgi:MFS family permease
MPAAFVVSALLSTWVLASARRRFQLLYALGLAIGTLFFPVIVFPIYLVLMLWHKRSGPPPRWRFTLPLLYGTIAVSAIIAFYYFDNRTVDAHLARANRAKLREDTNTAIREYKAALALEDNPHTHKLLAIELVKAGRSEEAKVEFRLAEQGGEAIEQPQMNADER